MKGALVILLVPATVFASTGRWAGGAGATSGGGGSMRRDPPCVEESDIVGYRGCNRRFAMWSYEGQFPGPFGHIGSVVRRMASTQPREGMLSLADESFAYRTVGGTVALETQILASARVGLGIGRGLFLAMDIEGGTLASSPTMATTARGAYGTPELVFRSRTTFNFLAVAGVQTDVGVGRFGVEVAGGMRTSAYFLDARYNGRDLRMEYRAMVPIVEARASYEHLLTPRVALAATVGKSVIDRDSWMGGIHVAVHGRTFAGNRATAPRCATSESAPCRR